MGLLTKTRTQGIVRERSHPDCTFKQCHTRSEEGRQSGNSKQRSSEYTGSENPGYYPHGGL